MKDLSNRALAMVLVAGFAPPISAQNFSLTISLKGTGSGTVQSAPAGILCIGGADSVGSNSQSVCSAQFASGTAVTLTGRSSTAFFTGWSGGACSGTNDCTLAIAGAARLVTANFERPLLKVQVTGPGSLTGDHEPFYCGANCDARQRVGTTVKFTANPASGARFDSWSGGVCSGSAQTCSLSLSAAETTVAARFTKPKLTVTKSGNGDVASTPAGINCGSTCQADFSIGQAVTLKATPAAGMKLVDWSGANAGGCSGTDCVVNLAASDAAVTAKFMALPKLTVSAIGGGKVTSDVGGINCSGGGSGTCVASFGEHVTVKLTATAANSNRRFLNWTSAPCAGMSSPVCTVHVGGVGWATSVTAKFD